MLFEQIEHLPFMKMKLIKQNFGMFYRFMVGWTMILVTYKVDDYTFQFLMLKCKSL